MAEITTQKTFIQYNEEGLLEVIDAVTGKVLSTQASKYNLPEENGRPIYQYTEEIGDLIAQVITEGYKISDVLKWMPKLNHNIIARWRRNNRSFDNKMKDAEKARADLLGDKILEIAEKGLQGDIDKETAAGYRIASDAFSKMAEVGDPGKYGKNREVVRPTLNIQIFTGVPQPGEREVLETMDGGRAIEDKGEGLPSFEDRVED